MGWYVTMTALRAVRENHSLRLEQSIRWQRLPHTERTGNASLCDMVYVLTMEGDGARFLACAVDVPDAATDAAVTCIEAQLADEGDPDAVAVFIAERLGPADIPFGHLFDGVDQWG